jgi:hypothetical protein
MPPIGFLPCCCRCRFCGDEMTPDYLTLTGASFIDRVLGSAAAHPGRLISPLSALNRAHQLDRVFAGRIRDRLVDWGGAADACGVFYEGGPFTFGDLFIGTNADNDVSYEEESNWARDLVYRLAIGLAVDPLDATHFKGAADDSGGSHWIGGSILPGQLYYAPTIRGDVASPGLLTKSNICAAPSSVAILLPSKMTRIKVFSVGSLPTWWRADTSTGGDTFAISYADTDGDALIPGEGGAEANEQTAATLSLIASAARS